MSSILKALKKLEQETAANTGAPLPAGGGNQNRQRTKSIVVPGLIVLSVCIIIGAGVMLFVREPSTQESASPYLNEEKPAVSVKKNARMTPPSRAEEADIREQKKPAAAAPEFEFSTTRSLLADNRPADLKNGGHEPLEAYKQQIPAVPSGTVHTPAPVKTADPFTPILPVPDVQADGADENNQPLLENAEPAVSLQTEISNGETIPPALPDKSLSEEPVVKKTEPSLEIIDDPSIDLQAISWSTDAGKRLAIINGKICREKDRVGGYVVQSINAGDVVISKGSVTGKLVFEIR